jgi:soluble lytic murein transglycosylase-like protein
MDCVLALWHAISVDAKHCMAQCNEAIMKLSHIAAAGLYLMATSIFAANDEAGFREAEAKAKIYRYRVGGTPTYSDIPPVKRHYVVVDLSCFACNPRSNINWDVTRLYSTEFSEVIESAAQTYKVDPALVRAIIHAESGFNARARSPKGAKGLMQLMPATAREVGVNDAYAPDQNIRGGARYLAAMLGRFNNDVTLAAAAYNAGPAAVTRYSGVPPYAETQAYVRRVNILYRRYLFKDRQQTH